MRSMFNRRSKTKNPGSPTPESNEKSLTMNTSTELSIAASVDNTPKGAEKSSLRIPLHTDGTVTSIRCKTASPQTELIFSHSCPSTTHIRRNGGVSVTFESTLPTQVWQASPNPSPPLGDVSPSITAQTCGISSNRESKATHKDRSAAGECRDGTNANVGNGDWQTALLLADTEDSSSSSSDIEDVHNSISFRSLLSTSTCSSSESDSLHREPQERRPKSMAASRHTGQPSPDVSHSNSSLEIQPEPRLEVGSRSSLCSSEVSKSQFTNRHHNSRPTHSDDRETAHERRRKHRKLYREGSSKLVAHADNSATIHSSSSNSSSTSSSGMEEMEALGWDDKTIAQLTRRPANSRRSKPVAKSKIQPKENDKPQALSRTTSSLNTKVVVPPATVRHSAEITWRTETAELQASSLFQSAKTDTFTEPPQSCLQIRRNHYRADNNTTVEGCVDYLIQPKLTHSSPVKPPSPHSKTPVSLVTCPTPPGSIQRLAIIISDYHPCPEWEQKHHVLTVHQGDYVCILSQGLSRNSAKHQFDVLESLNTWIYVRRWCTDHLTATGPPGFVPQRYCRLLTSSEVIHLWQHTCQVASGVASSSVPRNNKYIFKVRPEDELQNSLHFVPTSPISFNRATAIDRLPNGFTEKSCQSSTTVHPILMGRTQHLAQLNNYSVPSPETNRMAKSNHLKKVLQVLPPPPSGFGSGGSIGSETEDRDSGRGPSSGSEWGSGKGGSSNVTLDRNALAGKTFTNATIEHNQIHQRDTGHTCDVQSTEESHLTWNIPKFSQWLNEEQIEESYSLEQEASAVIPRNLIPQAVLRIAAASHNQRSEGDAVMNTSSTDKYPPVTLTTRTNCTPVLELRSTGSAPPTFYARYDISQAADKNKEVNTVNVIGGESDYPTMTFQTCVTVKTPEHQNQQENVKELDKLITSAVNTADPTYWEPYKTVLHVNENSLEKFTLV